MARAWVMGQKTELKDINLMLDVPAGLEEVTREGKEKGSCNSWAQGDRGHSRPWSTAWGHSGEN